ncbi:LPS export ABC transporter periplasmic protein LptC [candidate division GN15 bacterium]|nr:LPS export ABC transporter periplasmic protein LptC [candidate division GN15 bacterium]
MRIFNYILVMAALILSVACSDPDRTSNDSARTDTLLPDSELTGARIFLYDGERRTAEIVSARIVKFSEIDSTMAYDVDVNVLDTAGEVTTHVVGDSGVIRESTGFMDLYGNVVLTTQDTAVLQTDYLFWDSHEEKIRTDAFVRITKNEDVVTGWGLRANEDLSRIKILRKVSGTITDTRSDSL